MLAETESMSVVRQPRATLATAPTTFDLLHAPIALKDIDVYPVAFRKRHELELASPFTSVAHLLHIVIQRLL